MASKYYPAAHEYVQSAMNGELAPSSLGWVQEFERQFADRLGVKFAVAMNSGTSAIHAGLAALGVGPGDEVISPALTVIMDAYATLYLGATPVFADVYPDTWLINPEDVERKITERTKAIIVVSWFGLPVEIAPFRALSERYGIPLLDDSAETIYARDKDGRLAGTGADIGIFSFEEKKHLTTGGEGGMLVTNDEELAERSRKFGGIGYRHLTASAGRTSLAASVFQNPAYARFSDVGFNYRMTPIAAAIGLGQLRHLDEILELRRMSASAFLDAIDGCTWLKPQTIPSGSEHSYYTLGLKFDPDLAGLSWTEFYTRYRDRGGDGFYGNCLNPFAEPVFDSNSNLRMISHVAKQTCPVASRLQPLIMAFKTNYRDADTMATQATILADVIDEVVR